MLAIAVPKSRYQFGVLLASLRMKPLLELIDDQDHLPLGWEDASPSQLSQRIDQPKPTREFRTRLADALEQACLGLFGGRLDVDWEDVLAQAG